MHRFIPAFLIVSFAIVASQSQAADLKLEDKKTYTLWEGKAPGQRDFNPANKGEKAEDHIPVVVAFLPASYGAKPTGSSFVVCPGGGYGGLAPHEGAVVGEWLAKNGITAFVLRYRLGSKGYHHPIEMTDAFRAIRFVRFHSKEWNLDESHIGIIGFSAGGHLTTTVATHYEDGGIKDPNDPIDKVSSKPNAQIPIYPVVTMGPTGHGGSRMNLLGKEKANDKDLIELLSNEKHVDAKTPPAFVVHAVEDKVVPISNSDNYVEALKKAGVEVQYIRPEKGPHGFGLKDFWTPQAIEWLRKLGF